MKTPSTPVQVAARDAHRVAGEELLDLHQLQPLAALRLFTGEPQHPARPSRLTVGFDADLCLFHVPLGEALRTLTGELVRATYVLGRRIGPA
ncbi:hypothetical protein [Streptomyces sp. SAS_276]|uniref:hypothetical protein n=1 Tax=Streptomyces sp. SAS_276 TaxID=3412745 RepID=UPI00403C8849